MAKSMTKDAVRKRMGALPKMVEKAVQAVRRRDADAMILNWRNGIATRTFRLTPLRPNTVRAKAARGYTKPDVPLYGIGLDGPWTYIKALRKYKTGKGWVVKFSKRKHHSGLTEEELFEIHEYGAVCVSPTGKPFRIPPRPAFTRAYEKTMREMKDESGEIAAAIRDYIDTGKAYTFARMKANADRLEAMVGN